MEKDIRPCIPIKNKYSSVVLPIVLLVVDYIAIYLAESVSVSVRNCVMTGTYFQLSWLSTHVIVPFVFLLFMQVHGLYTKRMQFWRVISHIFKVNIYSVMSLVVIMNLFQSAAHTSRLFVGLMAVFSFAFLHVYTILIIAD